MIMYAAMLVVGFVYLVLMIAARVRGAGWQATVLKSFTSFFFLMTLGAAALAEHSHLQFAVFVGGGLLLGLLGDIWLDLKFLYPEDSDIWTMMGFLVFLVGHFFYLDAVFLTAGIRQEAVAAGLAGALLAIAFICAGEKPMHLQYGKFKTISTVYGAVLFFMAVYTLVSAVLLRNIGLLVMGAGSALFLLSDLVLSNIYFGENRNGPVWIAVNYVLYYAGQYLIASSVLWIGKTF
ncbi:MAG: lysoplasmalogenase [Lachnospiraceae bacterium]|nr:lysoplasmalogenase [Lachnospiraceae bacterium]